MESNESILRKIRALLAKTEGQGCTAEEASAAAEKAKQLLDEHNLSVYELNPLDFKNSVERRDIDLEYDRIPSWLKFLGQNIASAFDCRMLIYAGRKLQFIGIKADVDTTVYFFVRLMIDFKIEAEKQYSNCTIIGVSKRVVISNFIIGASISVRERLSEIHKSPSVNALMVIKGKVLEEFMNGIQLGPAQKCHAKQDPSAMNAGYQYGKTVELNKKLTNE